MDGSLGKRSKNHYTFLKLEGILAESWYNLPVGELSGMNY